MTSHPLTSSSIFVQGLTLAVGGAGVVGLLGVASGLANNKTCSPCKQELSFVRFLPRQTSLHVGKRKENWPPQKTFHRSIRIPRLST